MGIIVEPREDVVFEGFMRGVLLRFRSDVGVLDDGFGRSSMSSVEGAMEVEGLKVGGSRADAAGRTPLSDGKYNMDM